MAHSGENEVKQWMRKLVAAACLAAFSTLAAADMIVGLYAGAGMWSVGPGGNIGDSAIDVDALGMSDETDAFVYVALEHPIPLWPNVKLQHTRLGSKGEGTLSRRFRLHDVEFLAEETVSTELDLTHTDVVMYYELLDNVVSLDLGWTLRLFDGHASVVSRSGTLSESVDIDLPVPMAYARTLIELPAGFSLSATAHAIGYSGNSLQDLSAHVAYTFGSVVDVGIEMGYRRLALELDDDGQTDVTLDGPYVAVAVHF